MTTVHLGVSTFVTYPHQDDTRTLPLLLPTAAHSNQGLQLTTGNGDERKHRHNEGFQPQLQTDATKATSWNADEHLSHQNSDARCSKLT